MIYLQNYFSWFVSWQLNWVCLQFYWKPAELKQDLIPIYSFVRPVCFFTIGSSVWNCLSGTLRILHCGAVHPGKIWDGSKIWFSFVKCKENYLWKGRWKKENRLNFFTTSVFSSRSILGNMKMKFEDVEIDPLQTLSAYLPLGKSSYTPRIMHTPLLRLLVYIYYYKSNIYNICSFKKRWKKA